MPDIINLAHAPTRANNWEPWQDDAACIDEDPELFFPEPGDPRTAVAAAECCAICPVAEQCLTYALENRIDEGIFGGLSAVARKTLRNEPTERPVTSREQVASMTARHMTAHEIARTLGISTRQVVRLRSKKVPH